MSSIGCTLSVNSNATDDKLQNLIANMTLLNADVFTPGSCGVVKVGQGSGVSVILSSHSLGEARQRFLDGGGVIEVRGLRVISVFSFPARQTKAERDDSYRNHGSRYIRT